ncbi:MAG: hypothetical protein L0H29_01340, partial [Sinobacteraceae bacterium]|nr:hypothetical protein [Nevskiaceae bacterium]
AAEGVEQIVAAAAAPRARTAHNPFYAASDNLGTCWIARHEMQGPFVLINGDTLFEPAVFERLCAAAHDYPITLATDSKPAYDDDDMKVVIGTERRLDRVGKQLDPERVNGESIGMIRFDAAGARHFVARLDLLMRHESTLGRWYLSAVDELAAEAIVGTTAIDGLGWCELDDHADLEYARNVVPTWWQRGVSLDAASGNRR